MKNLSTEPIYKSPFSRAYWKDAAAQLFDVRVLCIAAILIAVRVALKSAQLPVGPNLNVTFGFFVNALGATFFGPVVAIIAAAISDTLGCLLFPAGPYFFPFIFVEIAGSLIFALLLWRAKLSATRIIISRFLVVAVCNFILNPTLMIWYYDIFYQGKYYEFITIPRVMKNIALFPVEAFLLVLFMGAMIPVLVKIRILPKAQLSNIVLTKKHIVFLAVLLVIAILIVVAYYSLFLPTQPQSQSITSGELTLTVKSDRGTYDVNDIPNSPITLTATLKNTGDTDITATGEAPIISLKLISLDGEVTAIIPPTDTTTKGDLSMVGAGTSVSITSTYTWTPEQLDGVYKGKYQVLAQAVVIVGGEEHIIAKTIDIKIK